MYLGSSDVLFAESNSVLPAPIVLPSGIVPDAGAVPPAGAIAPSPLIAPAPAILPANAIKEENRATPTDKGLFRLKTFFFKIKIHLNQRTFSLSFKSYAYL